MTSVLLFAALGVCLSGLAWRGWRRWHRDCPPASPEAIPRETLALQAFAYGNRRLAAGQFDEARAAFHQALALNPKHPDAAGRLAAVERQRHVARATLR